MVERPVITENDLRLRVGMWSLITGRRRCEIAQELGISRSYLSQILSGHRPGRDYVPQIEEIISKSA